MKARDIPLYNTLIAQAKFRNENIYLLNDAYTTPHAIGTVLGSSADPGPGVVDFINDTNADIVVSSGKLRLPTGASGVWYASKSRLAGLILRWTCDSMTNNNVGWDENQLGNATSGNSVQVTGSGDIRAYNNNQFAVVGTYSAETDWAIALRLDGSFLFMLRSGHWVIPWFSTGEDAVVMYPTFATTASGNLAVSSAKVPYRRWLPTPLLSDSFSDSLSNGLGHTEGITGNVGSGGDGKTWTGATWANTDGYAYNTPTVGSELLTDGALEIWSSATALTNWTKSLSGTSTLNQETSIVQAGTYSARLDIDASGSNASILQTISNSIGDILRFTGYVRASAANKFIDVFFSSGSKFTLAPGTQWVAFSFLYRMTEANVTIQYHRLAGAGASESSSLYFDTLSIKKLTLSTLFKLTDLGVADVFISITFTVLTGEWAGIAINMDSTSSPANGVVAYHDGTTIRLDKRVAGTVTNLISVSSTFVSGAKMKLRRIGTSVRLFYNESLVGTAQTISDAGIISNTLHGLYSTSPNNLFYTAVVYNTGTDGSYDDILNSI